MRVPASRVLEKISSGDIAPCYILMGIELYWRDRVARALQSALGLEGGGMGLSEFDLRQEPLGDVIDAAQSQSLLTPRQLIFVKSGHLLQGKRGRDSDDGESSGERRGGKRSDIFKAYMENPNPSTTLVFEMTDVDFDSDDWREKEKANSRVEAYENTCEAVMLSRPSLDKSTSLVCEEVAARGRRISKQAAEQLATVFDRKMGMILMEIEKLCLHQLGLDIITEKDLTQMLPATSADAGVELSDSIGSRDIASALEVLGSIKRSGKYPPLILSEIGRYLRQLILLKESKARDPRTASKVLWDAKLGAPQSAVAGLIQSARNFTGSELLHGLKLAADADLALRSSPPDEFLILERFFLQFVSRRARTKTNDQV